MSALLPDDFLSAVAGPVKLSIPDREARNGWSEPGEVHILVDGDLFWRPTAPPVSTRSAFDGSQQIDLLRESTKILGYSSEKGKSFEVVAPGADTAGGSTRRVLIQFEPGEHDSFVFWKHRIEMFTKSWEDLIAGRKGALLIKSVPANVYSVSALGQETTMTSAGTSTSNVAAAAKNIQTTIIDPIVRSSIDVNEGGLFEALRWSPMVGIGFAIVGYGLTVTSRYVKNEQDLPLAVERSLKLSERCLEAIISLEDTVSTKKVKIDDTRQKRYYAALADLETVFRILNEEKKKKGRHKILDAFFQSQGGASKMLDIALTSCESNLDSMASHSALVGVDLVRAMLTKAVTMIESDKESTDEMVSLVTDIRVDIKALVAAIVDGGAHTSSLLDATLLDHVMACKNIIDITRMYYSSPYQKALGRIEKAQGSEDKEEWSRKWAESLRNGSRKAAKLNNDRKACLTLLTVLCDLWRNEDGELSDGTIKKADIIGKPFEGRKKIGRILGLCLAMDRAQALYKMTKDGSNKIGMHWYAKQHENSKEFGHQVKSFRKWNKPTLNKRYVYLLDLEELGLRNSELLQKWSEPVANSALLEGTEDQFFTSRFTNVSLVDLKRSHSAPARSSRNYDHTHHYDL